MLTTVIPTTTTAIMTLRQEGTFDIMSVAVLICLLIAKELLSSCECKKAEDSAMTLGIPIYPLLFTFLLIVIAKVLEVLGHSFFF